MVSWIVRVFNYLTFNWDQDSFYIFKSDFFLKFS